MAANENFAFIKKTTLFICDLHWLMTNRTKFLNIIGANSLVSVNLTAYNADLHSECSAAR